MATGYDIWGVVASVIGFLSIFQIVAALINSRLPLNRLQVLEETLRETEAFLASVEEEGLFDDRGVYLSQVKRQVSNICKRVKRVRNDAFAAKTYMDELKQWWGGISDEISVCYKEVRHLRANISTTSSEARKALAQRQESESSILERDGAGDAVSGTPTSKSSFSELRSPGPVPVGADQAMPAVTPGEGGTATGSSIIASTYDRGAERDSLGTEVDEATLERYPDAQLLRNAKDGVPSCGLGTQSPIATLPKDTSHLRPDSPDTLRSYRRQDNLPPYPSSLALATTVLPRCTVTSADAARATRKLVKAYRQNLMARNVPWLSPGVQHTRHHAVSARALDRTSNTARHWKLLGERARSTLRSYVAVLPHEVTVVPSLHVVGTAEACSCSCSNGVQGTAIDDSVPKVLFR